MKVCERCSGNILVGYDELYNEHYAYCLQCGNRPENNRGRADGLPRGAAPKCQNCGQRDAYLAWNLINKAYVYQSKCAVCRARQSELKKARRRGSYAHKVSEGKNG